MSFKKMSNKKISILALIAGVILIGLAIAGYSNISKLGLTPEEYDISRDTYINMMFGGGRATSGSVIIDILMDSRVAFLWIGIVVLALGAFGIFYYTKHPEKDQDSQYKTDFQGIQSRNRATASSVQQNSPVISQNIASWHERGGIEKAALLLSATATLCFILGIGIFPYSLLSIAAGTALVFTLIKKNNIRTFLPTLPAILFMARFFLSETGYKGYDWITVLYRVSGYGVIALIFIMNSGGVNISQFEDDDTRLLSRVITLVLLINTGLAGIEFFRSVSLSFNLAVFRLGSIFFWLSLALFYLYAEKPKIQTKQDLYRGKQNHPYHTISGPILYFMIAIYVFSLACFIAGPLLIADYRDRLVSIARTGLTGYASANLLLHITFLSMITAAGLLIVAGLFLLWLNRKIRLRSPLFLLYYEYALFAVAIISIVTIFAANVWIGILMLLVCAIISFATMKWLTTSVRVRTYMGTDQYLRQALFTKKIQAPIPADLPVSQGQQYVAHNYISEEEWEEVPSTASDDMWEVVNRDPAPDEWEIVDDASASIYPQQNVYVRPDCCCICGNSLVEGYAILFTFMSGDEARVDRNCHEQLSALMDYRNPQAQKTASAYLRSRLNYIDPSVANYLNTYLQQTAGYGH